MTQPGYLPTFVLTLGRNSEPHPFFATCLVDGEREGSGFHTAIRRFDTAEKLADALSHAGIPTAHFADALAKVRSGANTAFEVSQNEGQKLGMLHSDTSE